MCRRPDVPRGFTGGGSSADDPAEPRLPGRLVARFSAVAASAGCDDAVRERCGRSVRYTCFLRGIYYFCSRGRPFFDPVSDEGPAHPFTFLKFRAMKRLLCVFCLLAACLALVCCTEDRTGGGEPLPAPAPENLTAQEGDGQVALRWTEPVGDGLLEYDVRWNPDTLPMRMQRFLF